MSNQRQMPLFFNGCRIRVLWFVVVCLIIGSPVRGEDTADGGRILFAASYSTAYEWTREVTAGFSGHFLARHPKIGVDVIELGTLRNINLQLPEPDYGWLYEKINSGQYKIIVAADLPALEILLKNPQMASSHIPLVCCGGIHRKSFDEISYPDKTGLLRPTNALNNIELGLKQFPGTQEIALITAAGAEGLDIHRRMRERLQDFDGVRLRLINGNDTSTADMLRQIGELPKNSFVVFTNWKSAISGDFLAFPSIVEAIVERSPGPVYATVDSYMDYGLLGGVISSGRGHGRETALICEQILSGTPVATIPVTKGAAALKFNWPQFVQYGLTPGMAEGAEFIHRQPSWWEQNRLWFLGLGALIALFGSWVFFLIYSRRILLRMRTIYNAMPLRIVVTDGKGKIHFHQLEQNFPDDMRTQGSTLKHIPDHLEEDFQDTIREVLATGEERVREYGFGDCRRRAVFSRLPRNLFGVETVMWISVDITELAQSRDRLADTAEYFRTTLESIGDGVIVTDADQTITMCNPVAADLSGYAKEEVIGKHLDEVFHIVDYVDGEKVTSPVKTALETDSIVELANHTDLIAPDGVRRHIADSAAPIHGKDGKAVGAVLVFRDVTEEYDIRDRLRMNHELLNNAAQLANIEYFHYDATNNINMLPCDRLWPNGDDGKPLLPETWVFPDDLALYLDSMHRLLDGRDESVFINYRAGCGENMRYYALSAQLDSVAQPGKKPLIFGVIQDVSDLKKLLGDFHDATGLLNTVMKNFPSPLLVKDISDSFKYVMANHHFAEMFERRPEALTGLTDFELLPDRADAERILEHDMQAMEAGGVTNQEESYHDKNGGVHHLWVNRTIVPRSDGTRLLVLVASDVSALKKAQCDLEEANQILRAILDNVHAGVTVKDPDHDFRYLVWNKWLVNQTGLSAELMLGKSDFETSLYPASQQSFREEDRTACETGFVHVISEDVQPDGGVATYDVSKKLVTLPWGKRLLIASMSNLTPERMLIREREQMIAQLTSYVEYERIINRCLQRITLQTDLEESIAFLLREIGETTHADRCYIFQFGDDGIHVSNQFEWVADGTEPQRGNLQNLDIRIFPGLYRHLLDKQDVAIEDLSQLQPEELSMLVEFLQAQQVKSVLISGIWENGRLLGFVGMDFTQTMRTIAQCDIHIVRNAAHLFLLMREREHRINALADSVSLQAQIFEKIAVPIMLLDAEFNVISTNGALDNFVRNSAVSGDETKCYRRYCNRDSPPEDCPVRMALKSGTTCTKERAFDGRRALISAQVVYDRAGKLKYILESGFDVTELQRRQENLDLLNRQQAAYLGQEQTVNECLTTLVLNRDFKTALQDIMLRIGRQLQVEFCAVFRYDATARTLTNVQKWNIPEGGTERNFLTMVREDEFPECFRALIEDGVLCADLQHREEVPAKLEMYPLLVMRGMRAISCVAIRFRNQFWGHIGVEFSDSKLYFGNVEMRLLTSAARIIEVLLEREESNLKLRASENEKNMIWELMTVPMVLFDINRNIIRVNPAMERLSGKSAAEIMAKPCYETLCHKAVPEKECPTLLAVRERKAQRMECTLCGRDFDILTMPVWENGAVVRVLRILIDITENNINKRKLLKAVDTAEAAVRAKSTFLATMSHEIRTPLNAVIGFSELLQGGDTKKEEQLEYLRSINFAGNALLQLINDILDLSKLEAGQMQIVRENTDLRKLCAEMMAIFSLRAKEKGLELRVECPAELPELELCVLRLRQVLLNLIGNAVKFTAQGHIAVGVRFQKETDAVGLLRIEISDTGMGISEEYKDTIFQPFIQQTNTRGNQEGTGLGLAISKRLIEHMDGTLSLESVVDAGSRFTITLPHIRYRKAAVGVAAPPKNEMSHPRRKILVVDDVPLNLKVLRAMLERMNAQVVCAASGKEALEMVAAVKPDLILSDMWMPGMNGVELAGRIREIPELANVLIFAVTGDTEMSGNFSMESFNGILLKPISMDKLHKMFQDIDDTANRR